jgi:hypothetical protein
MIIWVKTPKTSELVYVDWVFFPFCVSLFLMGLVLNFLFVKLYYLNLNYAYLHFPR